jgi:hypothetical protein
MITGEVESTIDVGQCLLRAAACFVINVCRGLDCYSSLEECIGPPSALGNHAVLL